MSNEAKGVIRVIEQRGKKSKFNEIAHVGVLLRSIKSKFIVENWQEELEKHNSITGNFKNLNISRDEWFSSAKIFVVPTRVSDQTKI